MTGKDIRFTVFTKPWKAMPLAELGRFARDLAFDGIELPVRPGFQVTPHRAGSDLPAAAKLLADFGLRIESVAATADEPTIAACAAAGVPILRVMAQIGPEGYMATEARLIRQYEALVPLLDRYGVTLGVQNHCGEFIATAVGLKRLVERFDRRHVAAVWDPAHCALDGEEEQLAAEILWPHLCMVNLKNAFWRRKNDPEAAVAEWEWYWTSGRQGLASWPAVAAELSKRSYRGPICLTAEYSDHDATDRLIAEDLAFAKSLFG